MSKQVQKTTYKSLAQIARAFGFSRPTISSWFNQSGAPAKGDRGYDHDAVAEFIQQCARTDDSFAKASPSIHAAKLEELNQRIRKLKIQNDQKEGLLIPKSVFETEVRSMANAVQRCLYSLPARCAVELVGHVPYEIERRMQAITDEVVLALSQGGGPEAQEWARQEIAKRKSEQPLTPAPSLER